MDWLFVLVGLLVIALSVTLVVFRRRAGAFVGRLNGDLGPSARTPTIGATNSPVAGGIVGLILGSLAVVYGVVGLVVGH